MSVFVFGSINMDLVVKTPRFLNPGETLTGRKFYTAPGGKGANQAVACARLGVPTHMVGRVGADVFGTALLDSLRANKVMTDGIWVDPDQTTGTALITVDDKAENTIIIIPGANGDIGDDNLLRLEKVLTKPGLLLLQLEIPAKSVIAAARLAKRCGVTVILDPAPAGQFPEGIYSFIDMITPNEVEAAMLVGFPIKNVQDAEKATRVFHRRGVTQVIIKMGSKGAFWSDGTSYKHLPAYKVKAVDTVAAGDAFNGALAAALDLGEPMQEALGWAMAAGALSTMKPGAQPSMPDRPTLKAMVDY
jgi:ribokinase